MDRLLELFRGLIWLGAGVLLIAPESARATVGIGLPLAWGVFKGWKRHG